ncbi:phosphotransferase [Vibrio albus]|uniref:Phosphotransferase n=1 Tax=Vibrio albus TaxID=2200953 RepID=A0A2U3B8V7_9VIBR|nr:phosphotransferase [Vibrio albus]PWI33239.1 phosphotransferase [Vibrio albus]
MNKRQREQVEFDESGKNMVVGEAERCPVPPDTLAQMTAGSDYVVQVIESGLTAEIFRIRVSGQDYTLKKKRPIAKVNNIDGKYSFLNEVQRRHDFEQLKSQPVWKQAFSSIVNTVYADYRLGIILSPWIEGEPVKKVDNAFLTQLLQVLTACEKNGLMEWDLCSGNMLVDHNGKLWLFDFGYMYPFDPLKEFNSNGLSDPIFHAVERFETRFFFGWLLRQSFPEEEQLSLFKELKQAAVTAYRDKIDWLVDNGAESRVIRHVESMVLLWQEALENHEALENTFRLEAFRSHVLDIEDDLHGESCTSLTLKRIDYVMTALESRYTYLRENGALFYANEDKSQDELLLLYRDKQKLAHSFQLS